MTLLLDTKTLTDCLYAAQAAALRAGNRIMTFFGGVIEPMDKGYGYDKSDLVTKADQEAQEIIEKILINYHPQIGFLAEENGQDQNQGRFEKPYFWSVDPIDGTHAFVQQQNGFAVSIALVANNGEPILGFKQIEVLQVFTMGADNQHLKIIGKGDDGVTPINFLFWRRGSLAEKIASGDKIDVAGVLEVNEWRGKKSVHIRVKDIKITS